MPSQVLPPGMIEPPPLFRLLGSMVLMAVPLTLDMNALTSVEVPMIWDTSGMLTAWLTDPFGCADIMAGMPLDPTCIPLSSAIFRNLPGCCLFTLTGE